MKRRDFVIGVGGTLLAIPTVLQVTACGGGDDDGSDVDAGGIDSFEGANLANDGSAHSHTFTVQCADLGGSSASYTATGPHTHSIMLDSSQLAALEAGDTVTFSTTTPHLHNWSVRKPSNAC